MMNAIGMIETKGLLAAIEGADAMLKAADVSLLDKSSATGGLITITVTGEVSAVQASIDAAIESINRLNSKLLISKHVIARPSTSLENIMSTSVTPASSAEEIEVEEPAVTESPVIEEIPAAVEQAQVEDIPVVTEQSVAAVEVTSVAKDEPTASPSEDKTPQYSASKLQKMNLKSLREIASELPALKTDIKKATKKTLIKAIRDSQINKGRK